MRRIFFFTSLAALLSFAAACKPGDAPKARNQIRTQHGPRVASIVLEDIERHRRGLQQGADRIAAGFVKVTGTQQEADMRQVMKLLRSPKKGIPELVISPMSFMAVVGMDGTCLARDAEPDKMKGMNLAKLFPSVRDALAGKQGMEVGQFESTEKSGSPSVTIVMAAPAHYQGQVVGALVVGIPLWRLQQRLTKQLQMELSGKKAVVVWVYVYRGDEVFEHGGSENLKPVIPGLLKARSAGYAKSPGGYTGALEQFDYWYGYGVRPLRVLGPDVGVVIVRMEDHD